MKVSFSKFILAFAIIFGGLGEIQAQKLRNLFVKKYDYNKLLQSHNQYSFYKNITFLKLDNYWGAIDTTGKVIVPFRYDSVYVNSRGNFIEVRKNEKLGLYSFNGRLISKPYYNEYNYTWYGYIYRIRTKGKQKIVGKITTNGKVVEKDKPPIDIYYSPKGEFAIMKSKNHWYICRNGLLIKFKPDFDTLLEPMFNNENGRIRVYRNYDIPTFRWAKSKNSKKKHHKLKNVTFLCHSVEGKLIAKKNNLYGLIDSTGKVIGSYQFDKIGGFYLGFAKVKKDGKYGLINSNGYLIGEIKYTNIFLNYYYGCRQQYYFYLKNSSSTVITNQGRGLINLKGEEICQSYYDSITGFENNVALVMKNGKWGVIDSECKEILPVIYEYLDFIKACPNQQLEGNECYKISNKRFLTSKEDNLIAIDRNGNEVDRWECDD